MIRHRAGSAVISHLSLFVLVASALNAQLPPRMGSPTLAGTSWQLVRFEGGDGRVLTPNSPSNYRIGFGSDRRVSVRFDCNRGSGNWSSQGNGDLTFGPLATTRALCGRGSMYDRIARDWPYVRSYVMRNGHLFLSLQADGGVYEFAPLGGDPIAGSAVRGTVRYNERILLPRNAVFEATLEDVSRAGGQSELIARVRNEQPGGIPIPFVISYDASRIIESHTYVVRSQILVNNSVWFSSDQNYPVLTGGRGSDVQLVLRRVGAAGAVIPPRAGTAALAETHWKLVAVGGNPVSVSARQPEPNLTFHSSNRTVSGNGGCNGFSGGYSLNGDLLRFSQIASTMMACPSPMNPEAGFLRAINATRRWRINGQTLELLDDSRNVLARLEADYRQ